MVSEEVNISVWLVSRLKMKYIVLSTIVF